MKKVSTILILLIIAVCFVSFWIIPDREASEMENRTLAQLPAFTVGGWLDSSFKNDLEDYVADQFPLRDTFLKTYKKLSTKKLGIPGADFKQIIEGTDGYNFYIYDENQILKVYASKKDTAEAVLWGQRITDAAKLCEDKDVDLIVDFVPSKSESFNDLLPDGAVLNKDEELKDIVLDSIPKNVYVIDTMAEFEKMPLTYKQDLYFHTDHHWNDKGSYEGFKFLCNELENKLGLTADVDDMEFKEYPLSQDRFIGSYNQNLGEIFPTTERLAYYMPDKKSVIDGEITENRIGRIKFGDIYATMTQGDNVSYATLYMNDLDYIHISNDKAYNDYSLLVIKDSYFNAIVPQMSLLFSDLYIVDTRYYKDFVLEDFIDSNDIDGCMLFYNSTSFIKTDEMFGYDVRNK